MNYKNIYYYVCMTCKKIYESSVSYYKTEKTLKEEPLCLTCLYKDFEGNQLNLPFQPPEDDDL